MDVKILSHTSAVELESLIGSWSFRQGFKLYGPVTASLNKFGDLVYVATLVREEKR